MPLRTGIAGEDRQANRADKPGLEVAQVRAAGSALKSYYRELFDAAANDDLAKQYETRSADWPNGWKSIRVLPGEEPAAKVNQRLAGSTDASGGNLVRSIRQLDRPNLFVAAKPQIVGTGIEAQSTT